MSWTFPKSQTTLSSFSHHYDFNNNYHWGPSAPSWSSQFWGGGPPQQPLRHWKFSSCKWVWEPCSGVHRGGDRGTVDRPVERPGSHLSWCADNRCETSPPFCGSLLGATTGLFVLIFNVFVIFQRSSDFMISVTYFALVNLAMSKVDVHQDQGDQYEDGQGQVRFVMLYISMCFLSDFSNEKQLSQTVVYNFIKVFFSF